MFSPKPRCKKKLAVGFLPAEHTALARYLFHRTPEFSREGNSEFFLIDPWKHDRDVVWSITQDLPNNFCQQQIIGRKTVVWVDPHSLSCIAGTFLWVSHFGLRHGKEPTKVESSRRIVLTRYTVLYWYWYRGTTFEKINCDKWNYIY